MHNPPHPGEVLKELYLDPLGLGPTEAGKHLKMSRVAISEIIHRKRGVTPRTAIKLAKAFGGSAESWLNMQSSYDLWQELQNYRAEDVELFKQSA